MKQISSDIYCATADWDVRQDLLLWMQKSLTFALLCSVLVRRCAARAAVLPSSQMLAEMLQTARSWDSSVSPTHMLCWCITNTTPSCGSMKEMSSHQNIRLRHWCQSAKQVVRCTFWNVKWERCRQDHFPFGKCINRHVGEQMPHFSAWFIFLLNPYSLWSAQV